VAQRLGFDSLKHSLHESRVTLRHLLRRDFAVVRPAESHPDPPYVVTDALATEVVLSIEERKGLSEVEAKAVYEAAAVSEGATPFTFDDLVARRWISVVLGRVRVSRELLNAVKLVDPASEAGIRAVVDAQHRRTRAMRTEPSAAAAPIVANLLADLDKRLALPPSPGSVAARLWEATRVTDESDPLVTWLRRWGQLSSAWFTLSEELGQGSRGALVSAILARLEAESDVRGWAGERERVLVEWYLRSGRLPIADTSALPEAPRTMLDRMLWLDRHDVHHTMHDLRSQLDLLVALLLDDIAHTEFSPAPHATMKELVRLADERPWILASIEARCSWKPELLADLVLIPTAAASAAMLLASMPTPSSAWDTAVRHRDAGAARLQAFEAFVAVVGHHLQGGADVLIEEVVALHVWLHSVAARTDPHTGQLRLDRSLLDAFGREVERWSERVRTHFADAHVRHLASATLGAPRLGALLDAMARTDLAAKVDGVHLLDVYAKSLQEAEFEARVDTIDRRGARVEAIVEIRGFAIS
jgi:hypothetical protein